MEQLAGTRAAGQARRRLQVGTLTGTPAPQGRAGGGLGGLLQEAAFGSLRASSGSLGGQRALAELIRALPAPVLI